LAIPADPSTLDAIVPVVARRVPSPEEADLTVRKFQANNREKVYVYGGRKSQNALTGIRIVRKKKCPVIN
jgi:hypothetical protein